MKNKYILLDEINLDLVRLSDGTVRMFEFRDSAIEYGEKHVTGWQVVEVPFGDC